MQAYQNSFGGEANSGTTRALLSPKSDFFRFFSTPTPAPAAQQAGSGPTPAKAD